MFLGSNITLIGMPGSGKSTVGRILAHHFDMEFIDSDRLIERAANMGIQNVVDRMGLNRFRELEQQVLCEIDVENTIISTGGSAVYSLSAMNHLATLGPRLYLRITRNSLIRRVDNSAVRGLYKLPSHSLLRLFHERENLYPDFADITFDNDAPLSAIRAGQLIALFDCERN